VNKIEKLIQELCPNGIELLKIGELIEYEQPTKYLVNSTEYDDSYKIPVLTAGQSFILGFTNEENGIYPSSKQKPVIIFDDFTTSSKWVDFPFKAKSSAMKMLTSKNDKVLSLRYFYFVMQTISLDSSQHTRYWISKYSQLSISVPPIEIQNEIVAILDQFTELKAELEAELVARRKQLIYCSENLCTKDGDRSYEKKELGEIATLIRGRRFVKDDIKDSGVPAIHYGEIYTKYNIKAYKASSYLDAEQANKLRKVKPGDIVMVAAGETIEDIGKSVAWLGEEEIVIHDACIGISSKLADPEFLAFYFDTFEFRSQLNERITSSKISAISPDKLSTTLVPLPKLDKQKEISQELSSIFELIHNYIPNEISARSKQFAYFRDKLLTFKELETL